MVRINDHQLRLAEEVLYCSKYLYGRMEELKIAIDTIMPRSPGSVLKMVGRPVAKTPMDTSITERYGILRATCRQAEELSAKEKLNKKLKWIKFEIEHYDRQNNRNDCEFIRLKYDKEYPPKKVQDLLELNPSEYYTVRLRILRRVWKYIKELDPIIELAIL